MQIGILGVLTVVFVTLKLCGLIAWSWMIVLIPLWVSIGAFFLVLMVAILGAIASQRGRKR